MEAQLKVYVAEHLSRLLKLMILRRLHELETKSTLKGLNLVVSFECLAFEIQTLTFKKQLRVCSCVLEVLKYLGLKLITII